MIELIEGKIRFSAQITDEEGNIIAKISRNEWQVAPPPRTWDKNYSDDALEVVDPKGRVVLQAKVLSDRIQIQGAWPAGPQWGPAGVAQIIVRADPSGSGAQFSYACRPAQIASGLFPTPICQRRRPDLVWVEFPRRVSASGRLRQSHPQWRKTRRPAGASADKVRACNQPEDREGARPYLSAVSTRPRR